MNARRLPGMDQLNNELKAKLIMSSNPLSSSCGNITQMNQLNRQSPMHLKMNQLANQNNVQQQFLNAAQTVDWQTSNKMANNYVSSITPQSSYLPNHHLQTIQNLQQLQNLQNLQTNYIKTQQKQLLNPFVQRRNLSLTDINSQTNVQLLANSFLPYATPFDMNGFSQSMDELIIDESFSEDDNCSSNSSNRKHRQTNKKRNSKKIQRSSSRGSSMNNQNMINEKLIRRSHSSAHLINPMFKSNPYDFDYIQQQNQLLANLYYAQPLLSPASSIKSLEAVKRKSSVSSMLSNRTLVNNDFNDLDNSAYKPSNNASRYRRSRETSSSNARRSKSLCRSKSQSSNRSVKSFKSTYDKSNRCISSNSDENVNDEETEFSESCSFDSCSNLDDSTQSELDDKKRKYNHQSKKQWRCKYCTYVNRKASSNICEMCSKSNIQMLNKINKENNERTSSSNKQSKTSSNGKIKNRGENGHRSTRTKRTSNSNEPNYESDQQQKQCKSNYIEFNITDELIKEQEEVEKELLRRIANEKLIEEENLRLEREQNLNDKSRTSTINSKRNESKECKEDEVDETNNPIKHKITNSSSPASSTASSSFNNSTNHQSQHSTASNSTALNKIVSKIKPPSISLKQNNQTNLNSNNKIANNRFIKAQSLDSSSIGKSDVRLLSDAAMTGRQREEKYKTIKSGFTASSNVQQFTDQQYNQRNHKQNRSEEQQKKSSSNILVEQPIKV